MNKPFGGFGVFNVARLKSRLFELGQDLGSEEALSVNGRSISFSDLAPELSERSQKLAETLESSQFSHLPIKVGMDINSHLDILASFTSGIPFCLIDALAPRARVEYIHGLLRDHNTGSSRGNKTFTQPTGDEAVAFPPEKKSALGHKPTLVVTTSGSTGQPKGAEISFDSLIERMEFSEFEISLMPFRMASFVPSHFVGGLNRLMRIFYGNSLFVLDPHSLSLRDMLNRLMAIRVESLSLPPQLARIMGNYRGSADVFFESVKLLRLGSEGIRYETLAGLRSYLPEDTIVRHSLGATEAAQAFVHFFPLADCPPSGRVPIGKPTVFTQLLPTSELPENHFEVAVTGAIAEGYLGQPELNRERFFIGSDGKRYWRSGDIVERLPSGEFIHFGRVDDIVKVRGILASPSEATAALMSIEGVLNAITIPSEQNGSKVLVSHVAMGEETQVTGQDLRNQLFQVLPPHLVPAEIFLYSDLPLTPRGKIDRLSLRALSEDEALGAQPLRGQSE